MSKKEAVKPLTREQMEEWFKANGGSQGHGSLIDLTPTSGRQQSTQPGMPNISIIHDETLGLRDSEEQTT
ncbi:hypothetical protein IPM62_01545 [Candidatus Woesebacteria bacterium]|nr:MAG: hypothetical protein IPM62_01545 [Candidatus Woesebacteria bacterium]